MHSVATAVAAVEAVAAVVVAAVVVVTIERWVDSVEDADSSAVDIDLVEGDRSQL